MPVIEPTVQHQTRWLSFVRMPDVPERKTCTWRVVGRHSGTTLGYVSWYGAWRQYTFWPSAETTFNEECLIHIAMFCRTHKNDRATGPEAA